MNKKELCDKIRELYPDVGECGIDVDVNYNNDQNRWEVDLTKGRHHLKTYLEDGDAESCMQGRQCVSLGIEIAQLRNNIEQMK